MRALDKGISIFDGISERELRSMGPLRTFGHGATLFPLRTYPILIKEGIVKLTAVDDARETLLSIHGAGDLLGTESVLTHLCGTRPRSRVGGLETTAIALTRVTARALQTQSLEKFLWSHPQAVAAMALGLHEQLEDAHMRIISAARDSADRRLARLLCDLERYGTPFASSRWSNGTRLPIALTRAELASWIGTCPKTVERATARWQQRGIISTHYNQAIVVHDLAALARIAGIAINRRAYAGTDTQAG